MGWTESILGSKPQLRVLRVLAWADAPHTGRQVHDQANLLTGEGEESVSLRSVQRALDALSAEGVVHCGHVAHIHQYSLNRDDIRIRHYLLPMLMADRPVHQDPVNALTSRMRPVAEDLGLMTLVLAPWQPGESFRLCMIPQGYAFDRAGAENRLRESAEAVTAVTAVGLDFQMHSFGMTPKGDDRFDEDFIDRGQVVYGRKLTRR
jgi:hypothetical protein